MFIGKIRYEFQERRTRAVQADRAPFAELPGMSIGDYLSKKIGVLPR
jgi:hypothetical protein